MASAQAELTVPLQPLVRQRLAQRILRATQFRVTMLVAGAGYGKSTALRDFLQTHPLDHVRFNVKPENRSLVSFVRGFTDAISAIKPHLRLSLAGALEGAKQAADPAKALADWLLAHLESAPTTIVIDDLHYVTMDAEVSSVSSLLRMLVDQTRGQKRWLISTRSNMNLPVSDWCESGAMDVPIDENDLRFTLDEARHLAGLSVAPLADDEVVQLLNLTDGWPVAFMLGLSAPERASTIRQSNAHTQGSIYRYLAQSLLDSVDPRVKKFLLETSVFPSLDGRLLENTDWTDYAATLAQLSRQRGIISLTSEGVPEYPELLREFFEHQLKKGGKDRYARAMQRAAQTLERSGRIPEALHYYTEIEDAKNITRLLEGHGFSLVESGDADIVQASMAITENEGEHRAIVLALRGFFEFQRGRFDTCEAWFRLAADRSTSASTKAEVIYRYCLTLMHRRQTAECIELLEPYVNSPNLAVRRQASVYSTLAIAYVMRQRFDEARASMSRALDLLPLTDDRAVHAEIYQLAAWAALFTGDTDRARKFAPMSVEIALDTGLYDVAARALSVLYNITCDVDYEPVKSLQILDQIADCGLKSGNVAIRLYALTGAFVIEVERGNTEAAVQLSVAISHYEVNYADVYTSEGLLAGQAMMMAANGQFSEAYELLAPSVEREITPDRLALRWSEVALYAAGASLKSEAAEAVRPAAEYLRAQIAFGARGVQIALNLVLALTLLKEKSHAETLLQEIARQVVAESIRLRCLFATVQAIFLNYQGARNYTEVFSRLQALRVNDLGGLALVYESLPKSREHC